jgi:hypothetical protein
MTFAGSEAPKIATAGTPKVSAKNIGPLSMQRTIRDLVIDEIA